MCVYIRFGNLSSFMARFAVLVLCHANMCAVMSENVIDFLGRWANHDRLPNSL